MEAKKLNKVREVFCVIRRELACYICKKVISKPYIANCGHSYCKKCIREQTILMENCPRCLFHFIYRRYTKKNNRLKKIVEQFKVVENAFQLDNQIDISEDLFERSFAVDAEIRKRFKNTNKNLSIPGEEIEMETVPEKEIQSEGLFQEQESGYNSEGTTSLINPNLIKKIVNVDELSSSELPTEEYFIKKIKSV